MATVALSGIITPTNVVTATSTTTLTNKTLTGAVMNGTLGATTPSTVVATTVKASTTMGVGGATPSTSGAGISFPATQSASTNANTLDDYEEGDWTAAFIASTSGSITMNNATGTYIKVGRAVTINGLFTVTSVSSPVGYLRISGLPFPNSALSQSRAALAINNEAMAATMNTVLVANVQSDSNIYVFKNNGTGGISSTTAADVQASTTIFIGGTYRTD
jgi:hypothetical protein